MAVIIIEIKSLSHKSFFTETHCFGILACASFKSIKKCNNYFQTISMNISYYHKENKVFKKNWGSDAELIIIDSYAGMLKVISHTYMYVLYGH